MKGGLELVPGVSAAARAAAWAKRFEGPITNDSKVYLSFRPSLYERLGDTADPDGWEPRPREAPSGAIAATPRAQGAPSSAGSRVSSSPSASPASMNGTEPWSWRRAAN